MPTCALARLQLEQRSASLEKTQTDSSRRVATADPYLGVQGVGSNDATARVGFVVVVVGDVCFCVFLAVVVERARVVLVEITGGECLLTISNPPIGSDSIYATYTGYGKSYQSPTSHVTVQS